MHEKERRNCCACCDGWLCLLAAPCRNHIYLGDVYLMEEKVRGVGVEHECGQCEQSVVHILGQAALWQRA